MVEIDRGQLIHAEIAHAFWTVAELGLVPVVVAGAGFFAPEFEVPELFLLGIEGIANWRRSHWAKQIEIIKQGGQATRLADTHVVDHVFNHATARRGQLKQKYYPR